MRLFVRFANAWRQQQSTTKLERHHVQHRIRAWGHDTRPAQRFFTSEFCAVLEHNLAAWCVGVFALRYEAWFPLSHGFIHRAVDVCGLGLVK